MGARMRSQTSTVGLQAQVLKIRSITAGSSMASLIRTELLLDDAVRVA